MSERALARLVWIIAALGMIAIGLLAWTVYRSGELEVTALGVLAQTSFLVALGSFVVSGAIIVARRPGNVVGWLLLIPGLVPPLGELSLRWLAGLDPPPVSLDLGTWLLLWFTNWFWVLLIFPVLHLLLTLPTGRLLSPRWRWVAVLEIVMLGIMMGLSAGIDTLQLMVGNRVVWAVTNPIGFIPVSAVQDGGWFDLVFGGLLIVTTVACSTAFVVRYRRGSSEERHQLKWPLWAIALFALVYVIQGVSRGNLDSDVAELFFGLSLAGIPVAIAIAVLRYRLYEIDRIISRTVSYAVVVALLAGVFLGVVTLVSSFLPTESSDLAIAGSTLAVAALFNPLRSRVLKVVDRRFNRSHYDAQRVIQGFAGSLQGRADSEWIVEGWVGVVSETMQPSLVAIWIRERMELAEVNR